MIDCNIYRQTLVAPCCNNGIPVVYHLEIEVEPDRVIMVEEIQSASLEAAQLDKPYHETIADFMHKRFGGRQIIMAHHHGTDIESRRGFDE